MGEKSVALPFTAYPDTLDGTMVGDVGFDPLGLAKTPELLDQYRLAELKHSRLAMLAAVGFIVSEEEDFKFASQLGLPSMLTDTDGRALDVAVLVFALDEEFLKVPVIDLIKDRTGGLFPIPEE